VAEADYTGERWLTIPFAHDYAVSDFGRVKRIAAEPAYRCGRLLKPKMRADGYPEVTLCIEGQRFFFRVHQLVCRTFHGERPKGKDEVGHIDGNRANARADNLRWVTKEENYADRNRHGTHNKGTNNGAAKLDPLKVQAVHILSEQLPSRKVAQILGISKSQVGNILRGEAWQDNEKRRQKRAEAKRAARSVNRGAGFPE
jgi:hypothetical protein